MFHVSHSTASLTDSALALRRTKSAASTGAGSSPLKVADGAAEKGDGSWELQPDPPDGGYGWVIVGCASFLLFVSVSGILTTGIFLISFADYFQVTKGQAAWIGSIHTGMIAPVGPVLPALLRRFGCRAVGAAGSLLMTFAWAISFVAPNIAFLFVTIGFLGGAAMPLIFMAASVSIQQYFDKRRATASSISVVGSALGMFIWPPLSQVLINYYSWRGACLLMGAVVSHSVIFSLLLRPVPMKRVQMDPVASAASLKAAAEADAEAAGGGCCAGFKERLKHAVPKICMFWGWLGIMGGHLFQIAITPIRAQYLGIPDIQGAMLVSVLGLVSGILRPVAGWLGDHPKLNRLYMVGGGALFCSAVAAVSLSFHDFGTMVVYAVFAGIGGTVYFALQAASIVDVYGARLVAPGFALMFVAVGIANVATVPIAGYLYDVTGSNFWPVMVLDFFFHLLGGVSILLIPIAHKLGWGVPEDAPNASAAPSGGDGVANAKRDAEEAVNIPVKFGLPEDDEEEGTC